MEPGAQVPGWSSSDDEGLSVTRQPSLRTVQKHSIPEKPTPSWHVRPPGTVLDGAQLPTHSPQDMLSSQEGSSTTATLQKQQLSTTRASEVSSGQLGPTMDPWAFEEDPPMPTSGRKQQQQRKPPKTKRQPQNRGLPRIQDPAVRRRRDLKKQTAVKERVRQWEIRLLRDIQEATQHELTIQAE
ncbi:coiled-coil domain-containing protein 201 [Talpa occidentalis]|uniref:coiled-coil domain-containing protein 201 n=1 Tax=Talpa occidentalis TaxID=50954 RepID=UPI0018902A4C|nr:coiled-coil domain-containing protein 201 [Talpa occidentalis]